MKNKTMLKIIFLSMVLSSCGLIERFKTPEQPTDSKEIESTGSSEDVATTSSPSDSTDDLFSKTMDETSGAENVADDNPTSIAENKGDDSELKSLEDEFSSAGPNETVVKEAPIAVTPTVTQSTRQQEAPVLVEEALPEIKHEIETPSYNDAGAVKTYHVQRGETLMQIAFKLYGDISKWKDIKSMNSDKLSSNTSLKTNTPLKYRAPSTPFVWNPSGTPYLIKNGETLGTISNSVYSTPKKWKTIWENNKPLIKNPNIIYAGFTLYYTNGGMANYVQPKAAQPTKEIVARELAKDAAIREGIVEEVVVDKLTRQTASTATTTETTPTQVTTTTTTKLAPQATTKVTAREEQQVDEAFETLSATKREAVTKAVNMVNRDTSKEAEIDLINNISVPHDQEIAPDIDEEVQTL